MSFTWLAGMIGDALKLAVNITDRQKEYLLWRKSDEAQRYYSAEENNAFWRALAAGNTDVIDTAISHKQNKIDELRRKVGLVCLLLCLGLGFTGCHTYTIPTETPTLTHDALISNEISYVVRDMEAKTPEGETKVLSGNWHVVSPDFIRTHVRNQDDLIKSLELLDKERGRNRFEMRILIGVAIIVAVLAVICAKTWPYEE